ncbi:phosphoribosylglycinamide formyltransferase [Citreimonas salinaria]|uniref:Phosphoribosylglycinamide formyltransferase n=1 Tax=Citreimonas salinaria TaxID=321339 RepID=A0A1H3KS55_9RHOB|nr:phosphoribosylglycinamide formyltransferase [Citreimonas salinaria]SDY54484.1 phosphoribosylglycinamide formyltransferase-1 [Citreimonas salinaria]
MTRVGILISGSGSNMEALVDSMTGDHPARACVVLSNVPGAGGLARAAARGVAIETVDHRAFGRDRAAFETALDAALAPHAPDILCLAGFMRVLTADFVSRWAGRMLNIHPSLLPKYRGLDTHARALAAGEAEHGCTVHAVTPALDDGPILGQARLRIAPDDTPATLAARVQLLEHRLYPLVLRRFAEGETDPVMLD